MSSLCSTIMLKRGYKFIFIGLGVVCFIVYFHLYMRTEAVPRRLDMLPRTDRRAVLSDPAVKLLVYWKPFNGDGFLKPEQNCLKRCPVKCNITDDKNMFYEADLINYHLTDLWPDNWHIDTTKTIEFPAYRRKEQIWVLTNQEPPSNLFGNLRVFNKLFNWTMWYRTDSVVPFQYGWSVALTEDELSSSTKDLKRRNFYREKSRNITGRISNCGDASRRYRLVHKMQQHLDIDMYGGCYSKKCYHENCNQPLEEYRFYLAFENSLCTDYVTEKYWDAISRDQIPIVNWDYQHVKNVVIPNSFISVHDFGDIKSFVDYLEQVMTNETLYNSYFDWRRHFRTERRCSSCLLCQHLYADKSRRVVADLEGWVRADICPKVQELNKLVLDIDRRLFEWGI
ncbi:alpha-(1,3)-fucosyltransferase C-like [Mya arenaria]|uniref:alpha-(1,3)-fucosyltransferase C-like n=1 Tax=Mya arenaria TaxID=6604 RepID=UPI0022E4D009|nr:alpha-(1,3)-fucosyltransferase C-like [Mya arenaria]